MVEGKVTVNMRLTINEYDKFTFKETLAKVEKVSKKKKLVMPYTFPLNTSPNYCFFESRST